MNIVCDSGTGYRDNQKRLSRCRPVAVRVNSKGLDKASCRLCAYLFFVPKNGRDARKIKAYREFLPPKGSDMNRLKSR